MGTNIHKNAEIDPLAKIGKDVTIGPFTIVEKNSVIGDGCRIGSGVLIGENTTLGKNNKVFHGAVIGSIAQDLKYRDENVTLEIGDNNIFREYCTINRGTIASGKTVIGSNCAFLAYCHVGHDCVVGNYFIASNNLNLAGHVTIGDYVGFGGVSAVHQFCNVGDHAYIGAYAKVVKDVPPYALLGGEGNQLRVAGINSVGLERKGFDNNMRQMIKKAYKILFRQKKTISEAILYLNKEFSQNAEISLLTDFIQKSERGVYRMNG